MMEPGTLDKFQRWMDAEFAKAFGVPPAHLAADQPPLTADTILASRREMEAQLRSQPRPIIYSHHALKLTAERLFPVSRHRSERVRKKLIRRLGGEYRMAPAIFQFDHAVIAHPAFRAEIEQASR